MASDAAGAPATDAARLSRRHTSASHTIGLPHLAELLAELPASADLADYERAVVDDNALGRPTYAGRRRTFRHLRELYRLDRADPEFRVLRRLWGSDDRDARSQLGGLLAFTSDELLRATFSAIRSARVGAVVSSDALAAAARADFGVALNDASLARLGRNAGASWTQTGHLTGRANKRRTDLDPRPSAIAYAVFLGHRSGLRGSYLLASPWTAWFCTSDGRIEAALAEAVRLGFLDLRRAGDVVDIDVRRLDGGAG